MVGENSFLKNLQIEIDNSELSSIKNSIVEIIRIINDPNANAKQLTEIIEIDPPLTGKILKVSNSPLYCSIRKITDVRQAIVRIGFDTIKEITLSQKVCELFEDGDKIEGFSRLSLWKHSIAVALFAKMLYRREFGFNGASVFTAGIMHDLGLIIEDQFLHSKFLEVLEKRKMMQGNILNAETEIIGFNHLQIGEYVAKNWGIPEVISECIGFHHFPTRASEIFKKEVMTIYVADYMVQMNEIGFQDTPFLNKRIFLKCLNYLDISEKACDLIIEDVILEISRMEKEGWFGNAK